MEARTAYIERYTGFFRGRSLKGMRLVCYQHSAVGRALLVEILGQLGAEVVPGGRSATFVPIDTENIDEAQVASIQALADQARAEHARPDAVVSTDGDSDRPLILALDPENGRVRFFGGDLLGMIAAEFLQADAVVVPISCNDAIDRGNLRRMLEAKTRIGSDRNVHKLPDSLSFEYAALAEPVACTLHAIDLAKIRSGDVALVLAGGTIGCIMTQLLLHSGASKVLISEPRAHRREICKVVGGIPVDPKSQDLAGFVREQTDGLGPEMVFDCLVHPALLEQGIELVQKGGTVFVMGVADPDAVAKVKPFQLFDKEIQIKAAFLRPYMFHRAVRWLPHLTLQPLLGVEYPLAQTKEAIHALREGKGLKIMVKP